MQAWKRLARRRLRRAVSTECPPTRRDYSRLPSVPRKIGPPWPTWSDWRASLVGAKGPHPTPRGVPGASRRRIKLLSPEFAEFFLLRVGGITFLVAGSRVTCRRFFSVRTEIAEDERSGIFLDHLEGQFEAVLNRPTLDLQLQGNR